MIPTSFRLIRHCEKLLEEKDEKLCIQVLKTLKDMITDSEYGEKVRQQPPLKPGHKSLHSLVFCYYISYTES